MFSHTLVCCLSVIVLTCQVLTAAAPEVGDRAPSFESIDEFGRPWKSDQHVQKKVIVLYFYPGDFTSGCTRQAQNFRENLAALTAKGVKVVGVSGDLTATHQLFKEAQSLNFTLLSDPEGTVAGQFGVPVSAGGKVRARTADNQPLWDADGKTIVLNRPVTFARWTLILDREGKVAYKNTKADPSQSSQDVLQILDDLEKKSK